MKKTTLKNKYIKPAIIHREKVEVLAAACDSGWTGGQVCRKEGQTGCQKTRF